MLKILKKLSIGGRLYFSVVCEDCGVVKQIRTDAFNKSKKFAICVQSRLRITNREHIMHGML